MSRNTVLALIRAAGIVLGYVAALSLVRGINAVDFYVGIAIGDLLRLPLPVAAVLLVVCLGVVALTTYRSTAPVTPRAWHHVDYLLTVTLACCAVVFCAKGVIYLWRTRALTPRGFGGLALLLSVFAYAIGSTLVIETVVRIRDRALLDSFQWVRFFRVYLRQPLGWMMAVLLGGILAALVILPLQPAASGYPLPRPLGVVLYLFAAFSLAALTHFTSGLFALTARYERTNAERLRAERFKVELITNVSHYIRTPLTSIVNYVDLLSALPVEQSEFRAYVTVLTRKTARLQTLIADLLDASKASTGNLPVDLRPLDLAETIGQVAGEFDDQFADRGLTLVVRQPGDPVWVSADGDHLGRVLENLFGNVAKYALRGTRVFADVEVCGDKAILSLKNVSESPIDVAPEALMDQFIRGDRSRHTVGSGLGLYIAKTLAELMGGKLTINATGDLFVAAVALHRAPVTPLDV